MGVRTQVVILLCGPFIGFKMLSSLLKNYFVPLLRSGWVVRKDMQSTVQYRTGPTISACTELWSMDVESSESLLHLSQAKFNVRVKLNCKLSQWIDSHWMMWRSTLTFGWWSSLYKWHLGRSCNTPVDEIGDSVLCLTHKLEFWGHCSSNGLPLVTQCHIISIPAGSSVWTGAIDFQLPTRFKDRFAGVGLRRAWFCNIALQTSVWKPDCGHTSVLQSLLDLHTSCPSQTSLL